jgi:hypothetical protein
MRASSTARARRWARRLASAAAAAASIATLACAPVLPERSKPGGAARWAYAEALDTAVRWSPAAALCRVVGEGVGSEGWLPDRGGAWSLTYWAPEKSGVLEVTVDTDGKVTSVERAESPARGKTLPHDWMDSPRVWATTRQHQKGTPLNTFAAELAVDAEPERYPGRPVWRIQFFLQEGGNETHVVSPQAEWLARY